MHFLKLLLWVLPHLNLINLQYKDIQKTYRFFVYPYIVNLLNLDEEVPIKAILKNAFTKKKNFVRFAKSKLSATKNGRIEVEILKGQESFRIKSFVKSNIWALLPADKSKFKKCEIVDCFLPNHSNQTLL